MIGKAVFSRLGSGENPHYSIEVVDNTKQYRIAVNVQSDEGSDVEYVIFPNWEHPIIDYIQKMEPGLHPIENKNGMPALDYIRANIASPNSFISLPKKPFKELVNYSKVWLSLRRSPYDIVINVVNDSSSGRLSAQFAKSRFKFFGGNYETLPPEYQDSHIAKQPVYYFRYCLNQLGIPPTDRPVPLMNLKLSATELEEGKKKLKALVNNDQKTICLFTYATGDKCYSKEWWGEFYERLKLNYPSYNIMEILPVENISNISFKAPTYSHPDIRNVGSVIANTTLFIGADGGVMHLATAVQVPTLGLFSITDPKAYAPYNAGSTGVNTNENSADDLFKIIEGVLKG